MLYLNVVFCENYICQEILVSLFISINKVLTDTNEFN